MTRITLSALKDCDAAIMVILADSPFANSEEEFVRNHLLTGWLGQIIFVVNGIDRLSGHNEVRKVVNFIETRIHGSILEWVNQEIAKDPSKTT